jgi:hypothetical protein
MAGQFVRRAVTIAAASSAVLWAILVAWVGLAVANGSSRSTWNVGQRLHPLVLSGGQTITGTSGYSLCTGRDGVTLYYLNLDVVVSREKGLDGRPISGSFSPSLYVVLRLPFWSIVAATLAAIPLPAVWFLFRFRRRVGPGFPVLHQIRLPKPYFGRRDQSDRDGFHIS